MASREPGTRPRKSSARSTLGGPSAADRATPHDRGKASVRAAATDALARQFPFNAGKAEEHGERARRPPRGRTAAPSARHATASTLTEDAASTKLGRGAVAEGEDASGGPLDRARNDATGRGLTTDQGVPIADNQNSLKAGLRGPTLLEDFILREKITHFDHERIPERIVHARGSGAHGVFECYAPLPHLTRAAPFAEAGKRTPVFARFSTVVGERGSTDTARDVRGFAVKFYTDEGNWDLVGNNIPVFFIQDAMKFPDLVHSVKPEPHHGMPQATAAHDTFWDFASLMPESTHMLTWVMSDRAIPRSYRMMEGFGVHTFRLVAADGSSRLVKFHWKPLAGLHSLTWDEAVKISGADPDFHRRDLWEAIEAGDFPQWELGLQVFTEEQAAGFSFDVLDPTKLVPEELVPVKPVGLLTLNRNPDNFFAETEQVAFCPAHLVPGIDFTNDPLLAGRIHSYVDTQLSRLGGPNFHEIPINQPVAAVHNNQRDGLHRRTINRGRVAYEPNSLGGGCPFQAGVAGFTSFPEPAEGPKLRGKPEKFADHYTQARLFYESQSPAEQAHIAAAFRFELSRVQVPAIRERVVAMLANASPELAARVAEGLGFEPPSPLPRALEAVSAPEITDAPTLSILRRPQPSSLRSRRIAILVAPGSDAAIAASLHAELLEAGAVPRIVAPRLGTIPGVDGREPLAIELSIEAAPSVLFDASIVAGGRGAEQLRVNGPALDFVREHHRHGKSILAIGRGAELLDAAGLPRELPDGSADPGLVFAADGGRPQALLESFQRALEAQRHFGRESDPPRV